MSRSFVITLHARICRHRLATALILCSVLAVIWSEGIAVAEQVNPAGDAAPFELEREQPGRDPSAMAVKPAELVFAGIGALGLWVFFASRWHRLNRAPRRPNLVTPTMGFILVAMLFLAAVIGVGVARTLFGLGERIEHEPHPVRAQAILGAGAHLVQLLVLLLPLWLWSRSRRVINDTRPHQSHAVMLGLGGLILFWPIVMLASIISSALVILITGKPVDPIAHGTLALFREHTMDGWMVLLIVIVVFAAPIVEEVMYRGLVQESIGQLGVSRWTSIVLTSIFFALMHLPVVEPHALVMLFVLSLGFGWMYEKTGRLAAPIAMHAAFNAGNLALVMVAGAGS